ncbi:hypothetical protein [Streptomyces sp. NPDC093105]|uniref:hypothetical protein n=1 Tax=Streptomyces sp. NPDC093105 TaxID=3366029 RepID=UPI0037F557AE
MPSKPQIQKRLNEVKGDSLVDGRLPEGAFGPERGLQVDSPVQRSGAVVAMSAPPGPAGGGLGGARDVGPAPGGLLGDRPRPLGGGDFEHLVLTLRAAFSAIGRPCPPATWRSLLGRARAGDGWHPGVTQGV